LSIWNDPSAENTTINLLGLVEGFEGLAIAQGWNDYVETVTPTGKVYRGWDFSIPKEPAQTGLQTYDGGSAASGGIDW
jgi:hypothetical protein